MRRFLGDQKYSKIRMPGSMDRGPTQFESRAVKRAGDVLIVGTPDVVTAPPTTTIMGAMKTMISYGFRRLPITDAGTNRLIGFVTCVDVVDFLGGGIRHNLLRKKYEGNIFVAINAEIREIMNQQVIYADETASVDDALKLMYKEGVGGLPIVDDDIRLKGIITEQDFVSLLADVKTGVNVESFLSPNVVTVSSQTTIWNATGIIVKKGFRRLPVVQDGVLIGMVTSSDIMRYMGSGEAFKKVVTGDIQEVMEQPLKSLINRDLVITERNVDLGEAGRIMMERDVGSLPVMDKGSLVGILTERDFIRALVEHEG